MRDKAFSTQAYLSFISLYNYITPVHPVTVSRKTITHASKIRVITFGNTHLNHLGNGTSAIMQDPIIQPKSGDNRLVKLSPI